LHFLQAISNFLCSKLDSVRTLARTFPLAVVSHHARPEASLASGRVPDRLHPMGPARLHRDAQFSYKPDTSSS